MTPTATLTAGYRSDGLRAWKAIGTGARTYFVYDRGRLIAELDETGAVQYYNTWSPDGLVARTHAPTGTTSRAMSSSGRITVMA